MDPQISRRALIVAGLAFAIAGCRVRTGGEPEPVAAPIVPRPPAGQWYEVVAGDTLHAIARRSGIPVERIVAANSGIAPTDMLPGVRVWLPGATPGQLQAVIAGRPRPGAPVEDEPEAPPAAARYTLVPRSAWTTRPVGRNRNPMNGVTRITIHHTGEHAGLADLPEVEVLRRIERYHRDERGWCAIGYHYIIGKDGRIYEGRPAIWQGAHVLSENEHNLGISVSGDFMRRLPSQRQLTALEAFLGDMAAKYRVGRGRIYGHRDLNNSKCPGDELYAWLKRWKRV